MQKFTSKYFFYLVLLMPFTLSSCEVIGDIFKAGVWMGVIGVVLVVAILVWIIGRIGR